MHELYTIWYTEKMEMENVSNFRATDLKVIHKRDSKLLNTKSILS